MPVKKGLDLDQFKRELEACKSMKDVRSVTDKLSLDERQNKGAQRLIHMATERIVGPVR